MHNQKQFIMHNYANADHRLNVLDYVSLIGQKNI